MQTDKALDEIVSRIISTGKIDAEQVKRIRLEIFSEAKIIERMLEDGIVDRHEAEALFSINDSLSEGQYDASWRDLFVEAITSHVLKDEISPGMLDEKEAQFILMKVQKDGPVNPVEMELLANVSASVMSAPSFFHTFVLGALKDYILRDGLVDEHDVRLIRSVIFGLGSSSGKFIDNLERGWLREIDELAVQEKNHPSWSMLKLELELSAKA